MPLGDKTPRVYLTAKEKDGAYELHAYDNRNKEKSVAPYYTGTIKELGKRIASFDDNGRVRKWPEFLIVFEDSEDDAQYILSVSGQQFNTGSLLNQIMNLKSFINVQVSPYINKNGFAAWFVKDSNGDAAGYKYEMEEVPRVTSVEVNGNNVYDFKEVVDFYTEKLREFASEAGIKWHDRTEHDPGTIGDETINDSSKVNWDTKLKAIMAEIIADGAVNGFNDSFAGKLLAKYKKSVEDPGAYNAACKSFMDLYRSSMNSPEAFATAKSCKEWASVADDVLKGVPADVAVKMKAAIRTIGEGLQSKTGDNDDDDMPF